LTFDTASVFAVRWLEALLSAFAWRFSLSDFDAAVLVFFRDDFSAMIFAPSRVTVTL
jgi:hypothetical protein